MRGHEPLIAMRRRGLKPACVWLTDTDSGSVRDWHLWAESIASPWVLLEAADTPQRADLRFVVGLQVFVDIDDPDRMRAVVEACRQAGAARAVGFATRAPGRPSAETLAMADTAGVFEHG